MSDDDDDDGLEWLVAVSAAGLLVGAAALAHQRLEAQGRRVAR